MTIEGTTSPPRDPARLSHHLTYSDEFLALFERRRTLKAELDATDSRLLAMADCIESCPVSALRLPSGRTAIFRDGRPALWSIEGGRADAAR